MDHAETIQQIKLLRAAIRYHRDQKGDDRCWVDDYLLWKLLSDTPSEPTALPPFEEMMKACRAFYLYRRTDEADLQPADANVDSATWDQDLEQMTLSAAERERETIESSIRIHRDIQGRDRTVEDDRLLYRVLPEKMVADFRLPPEEDFLGEHRAPKAGCPSFWRSHEQCPCATHDIHAWGPCRS
ncbi:hypothetical protein KBA73_02940 [Patescibacteria group bacterium]|nr:hypothetical protein [Patescibacteria group bacterium]